MCKVSQHALERARTRWNLEKSAKLLETIKDTYERAEVIGEYIEEDGKPRQLMLDKPNRRVLSVNPAEDVVVTVWMSKMPPLAPHLYSSVIQVHKRQIASIIRRRKQLERQYNAKHEQLMRDKARLDAEIARMKLERDHIAAIMDNHMHDMVEMSRAHRSTLQSLAHYRANEGVSYAQELAD